MMRVGLSDSAMDAQRLLRAAHAALARDDPQSALDCLVQASRRTPKDPRLHVSIGVVLQMLQRPTDAEQAYNNALKVAPNNANALLGLGSLRSELRQAPEVEELARRALLADPANVKARLLLVRALQDQDKLVEAEEELVRTIKAHPSAAMPRTAFAGLLHDSGRFGEAREQFTKALELDPFNGQAYLGLVRTGTMTEGDRDLVGGLEKALTNPSLDANSRTELLFCLGKAYDDLREYAKAMEQFSEANRLRELRLNRHRSISHDGYNRLFDGIQNTFTKESVAAQSAEDAGPPKPIFIVGMLRSGTTLAEQILTRHSSVAAGGEIDFWSTEGLRCVDLDSSTFDFNQALVARKRYQKQLKAVAGGLPFATDKMPDNYRMLGVLAAMYPGARIIHCVRHPVDTCLSIYFTPFRSPQDYFSDLEKLAFVYKRYQKLMAHWRAVLPAGSILDVHYGELIEDQEATTRRMLAFCGLEWEDECLRPEDNTRAVKTASAWQVRQPVYRSSLDRWRNYEPWIGPLADLVRPEGPA